MASYNWIASEEEKRAARRGAKRAELAQRLFQKAFCDLPYEKQLEVGRLIGQRDNAISEV